MELLSQCLYSLTVHSSIYHTIRRIKKFLTRGSQMETLLTAHSPQHHHRHYPPTKITLVLDLKTGICHGAFCIAVPMTITGQPCRERHQHILYARDNGSLRTHMLHQQ